MTNSSTAEVSSVLVFLGGSEVGEISGVLPGSTRNAVVWYPEGTAPQALREVAVSTRCDPDLFYVLGGSGGEALPDLIVVTVVPTSVTVESYVGDEWNGGSRQSGLPTDCDDV